MRAQRWSDQEIEKALSLYESGFPCSEIAGVLARTESAVRLKLLSLGFSSRRVVTDPVEPMLPDIEPCVGDVQPEDDDHYKLRAERELDLGDRRRAERDKVEDAKRVILEDRIVEEFRRCLCDLPLRIEVPPRSVMPATTGEPLTAVLVVSDLHVGQVVDPREVDHQGKYDPVVLISRLHHLELESKRILASHPVDKLLLLLAGDMLHGRLGHSLEDDLTLPIALQADLALHTLFPFIMALAGTVPAMEIYGVAGNHGRWPGTRKMPTDRRWSNLDTILYGSLAALIAHSDAKHVSFDDRISSRRTIDVGTRRIQLMHGDEIRGGTFCVAGMSREVSNSTLRHVQRGASPIDYYVIGDKHFTASIPFGNGAFVVNGSFVGLDGFGMNFLPAPPSQTLFFLHPELGKIETHEIRLDHAKIVGDLPYQLKPTLVDLINQYRK